VGQVVGFIGDIFFQGFFRDTDGTQGRAAAPAEREVLRRVSAAWWGIQTSATFQSIPGPADPGQLQTATNAQVRGSLMRDLAAGANGTVTIPLIKPGTMYADRAEPARFRLSRVFTVSRTRLQASMDIFNALKRQRADLDQHVLRDGLAAADADSASRAS